MQDALVFEDPDSRTLLLWARQIARGDANVLISGEPGSGKTALAHEIHACSPRRSEELRAVDCSGPDRSGLAPRLREALQDLRGGTLLLDNVADLPPPVQTWLTHTLSSVRPDGPEHPNGRPPVRILATSAVPLEAVVQAERFRRDLYHRLRVAALEVPPLRNRPGDIVPLALRCLARQRQRLGWGPQRLSAEVGQLLRAHRWPGNIRELEQRIRALALTCRGNEVSGADLVWPLATRRGDDPLWATLARSFTAVFAREPPELHKWVEQTALRLAYHHCRRSQAETARLLGLSRNLVRARLIEMGELAAGPPPLAPAPAPAAAARAGNGAAPALGFTRPPAVSRR